MVSHIADADSAPSFCHLVGAEEDPAQASYGLRDFSGTAEFFLNLEIFETPGQIHDLPTGIVDPLSLAKRPRIEPRSTTLASDCSEDTELRNPAILTDANRKVLYRENPKPIQVDTTGVLSNPGVSGRLIPWSCSILDEGYVVRQLENSLQ